MATKTKGNKLDPTGGMKAGPKAAADRKISRQKAKAAKALAETKAAEKAIDEIVVDLDAEPETITVAVSEIEVVPETKPEKKPRRVALPRPRTTDDLSALFAEMLDLAAKALAAETDEERGEAAAAGRLRADRTYFFFKNMKDLGVPVVE